MTKNLKITALVLFVIVDLVAAVLTFRHVNQRPVSSATRVAASSETPSEEPTKAEPKAVAPTGLAVTDGVVALFAQGSCDDPGVAHLEMSVDQAKNFTEVGLPVEEESDASGDRGVAVSSILAVSVESPEKMTMIGQDLECQTRRYTTENAGEEWKAEEAVAAWYVEGESAVSPTGPVDAECEVLSVWPISDRNARVGCKNGGIRGTDSTGETWVTLGILPGLTAVTFSSIGEAVGVAEETDCASRAYETGSGGGQWQALGCIDKNKKTTAIAGAAGLLVALVDAKVSVSTDEGNNWERP